MHAKQYAVLMHPWIHDEELALVCPEITEMLDDPIYVIHNTTIPLAEDSLQDLYEWCIRKKISFEDFKSPMLQNSAAIGQDIDVLQDRTATEAPNMECFFQLAGYISNGMPYMTYPPNLYHSLVAIENGTGCFYNKCYERLLLEVRAVVTPQGGPRRRRVALVSKVNATAPLANPGPDDRLLPDKGHLLFGKGQGHPANGQKWGLAIVTEVSACLLDFKLQIYRMLLQAIYIFSPNISFVEYHTRFTLYKDFLKRNCDRPGTECIFKLWNENVLPGNFQAALASLGQGGDNDNIENFTPNLDIIPDLNNNNNNNNISNGLVARSDAISERSHSRVNTPAVANSIPVALTMMQMISVTCVQDKTIIAVQGPASADYKEPMVLVTSHIQKNTTPAKKEKKCGSSCAISDFATAHRRNARNTLA
ncbi:hypothetical protein OBBRIDRAFT_807937 [Obba rivulosa]|uniref:Uncharacterized protein n=1 Tax=Obba rivulosa TaxID=1052685 RepID=A0A8E2DJL1_9APHY|nr:hypothetical protein OBBRIDRAFT_807937 [Obba rivulosa]